MSASKENEPTQAQTKEMYNNLPEDQQKKQTYSEWLHENYNYQYEQWMPWIEDQYLKWFGKGDNKASYATKDTLSKTKVTGIKQVDQIQDDVNNLVGNQLGENGLLAPIGNLASKEGINKAERGGKNEKGSYGEAVAGYSDPVVDNAKRTGEGLAGGAQAVGGGLADGVKGAGGYVGGMFGGKK